MRGVRQSYTFAGQGADMSAWNRDPNDGDGEIWWFVPLVIFIIGVLWVSGVVT